jgi:alpha-glucosidase
MILGIQEGIKVCRDKTTAMVNQGAKINGIWAQDWEGQRITAFGKQIFIGGYNDNIRTVTKKEY